MGITSRCRYPSKWHKRHHSAETPGGVSFFSVKGECKKFLRHVILYYDDEVHIIWYARARKIRYTLGVFWGVNRWKPQCLRRKREMCHLCHLERYVYVFFTLRAAGRCAPNGRPMRAALTGDVRRADYQG